MKLFIVSGCSSMNINILAPVIIIFVVVWIVSNVIRAQQDASQAAARRSGKRQGGSAASGTAPEKTSSSDIDRFLQEIDRLRKKNQDQPVAESQAAPPPKPLRPVETPRMREQPARRLAQERSARRPSANPFGRFRLLHLPWLSKLSNRKSPSSFRISNRNTWTCKRRRGHQLHPGPAVPTTRRRPCLLPCRSCRLFLRAIKDWRSPCCCTKF